MYDNESILTVKQIKTLDSIIELFEKKTTNEIVILTTDNIGDSRNMSDYAVDFGNKNRVGKKDKNNGLIIVISKKMRQAWLSTGYGTEEVLKDEICKQIIDSSMIPHFKEGDYYLGIKSGLESCIEKWE